MMKGFFLGRDHTRRKKVRGRVKDSKELAEKDPCEICGLYKGCQSPKMKYTGKGRKKILILAEAPGSQEDKNWKKLGYKVPTQLVGQAGQLFRKKLKKFGIDLDRDCWKDNSLACWPPNNREPTQRELKCCSGRIWKVIEELKPEFIWLMGSAALKQFYLDRFSNEYLTLAAWRKRCIPDRKSNAWVIPLYHPSFLLRKQGDGLAESLYDRDLEWAISCLGRKKVVFKEEPFSKAKPVTDYNELMKLFDELENFSGVLVLDYETTGLNPFMEGQKILTIGMYWGDGFAYAFPFQYPHWEEGQFESIKERWKKVMINPAIKKVGQNIKFEELWTRKRLGVETNEWIWDTMIASHILDEGRGRTTGLELQAYWRWGFEDHGKKLGVSSLMKDDSDKSGFNKLHTAELTPLLTYNAIDVYEEYLLYTEQKKEFERKEDLKRAYTVSFEGILAFVDTEETGISVDDKYYQNEDEKIGKEIGRLERQLIEGRYGKRFKAAEGREINLNSSKDLQILLFDIMKETPIRETKTGHSTDEDTLLKIDNKFTRDLLRVKKLTKIKNTYLSQFIRYSVGGRMHPSFNLHIAKTFRSSSACPNFQNIPIREEEARNICRGGIIPSSGNRILEVDYEGAEVCGMACCSHDPKLMEYINDPNADMHRDQACEIFLLEDSQITKELRQVGKNSFVFPEFYGDYYRSCALSAWEAAKDLKVGGISVYRHLKKKGIRSYIEFEDRMQKVENKFWKLFKITDRWRQDYVQRAYIDNGYSSMHFGYRRTGFLSRKHLMNTPVQNFAFICLLWSYIEINKIRKKEGWGTRILGQIHDSILFDTVPEEQKRVVTVCKKVMCEDIREKFPFIIVPLSVDFEVTPVDGAWNTKEKLVET